MFDWSVKWILANNANCSTVLIDNWGTVSQNRFEIPNQTADTKCHISEQGRSTFKSRARYSPCFKINPLLQIKNWPISVSNSTGLMAPLHFSWIFHYFRPGLSQEFWVYTEHNLVKTYENTKAYSLIWSVPTNVKTCVSSHIKQNAVHQEKCNVENYWIYKRNVKGW